MNSAKPLSHADYVRLLSKADSELANSTAIIHSLLDDIGLLLAENARLRAALTTILNMREDQLSTLTVEPLARAALAGGEGV